MCCLPAGLWAPDRDNGAETWPPAWDVTGYCLLVHCTSRIAAVFPAFPRRSGPEKVCQGGELLITSSSSSQEQQELSLDTQSTWLETHQLPQQGWHPWDIGAVQYSVLKALRAPRQHHGVTSHPSGRDLWHLLAEGGGLGSSVSQGSEHPTKPQHTKGAGSANQPCSTTASLCQGWLLSRAAAQRQLQPAGQAAWEQENPNFHTGSVPATEEDIGKKVWAQPRGGG